MTNLNTHNYTVCQSAKKKKNDKAQLLCILFNSLCK